MTDKEAVKSLIESHVSVCLAKMTEYNSKAINSCRFCEYYGKDGCWADKAADIVLEFANRYLKGDKK